ncbi:MAG TPA: proline--tRNA ligase [Bacteroidetes bacterium]|nr:proline--tRNA ligase [Bacteroidota bacterium]HEX04667.1 proline--tRNA ligase [Bacteroidota bacterium]
MRLSKAFLPTLKEVPADAVVTSHKLMLRTGMVRPLMAGVYSYLPFGQRAARKAMDLIREEMDSFGGQEFSLPTITPIELWDETGRNSDFGNEMFRLKDRKDREMALAPTHEEVFCSIARNELRSYKELPQIWYQIQIKFRDEPRPRSGELRTRHFIMKDAYSFDVNEEGLDKSYQLHRDAYQRIFHRAGLKFFIVGASSGVMGGSGSEEFMVESDAGEDTCAINEESGYAANVEVATSSMKDEAETDEAVTFAKVHTPGYKTVEEVAAFLKLDPSRFIKSLVYVGDDGPVMLLVRGDDELNEDKVLPILGAAMRPAQPEEVKELIGAEVGYLGPVGLEGKLPIYADLRLKNARNRATGANEDEYHVVGVQVGDTFKPDKFMDLRMVREGEPDPIGGRPLKIVRAIELGHIFKLGTKYSKPMGATVLNENGKDVPIIMGSYGIGVGRLIAAALEAHSDDSGCVWPMTLAPYHVAVITLKSKDENVAIEGERLYKMMQEKGLDVALDDRNLRPGFKFKDADLLGYPFQVVVSERNLAEGKLEIKRRRTGEQEVLAFDEALTQLDEWIAAEWDLVTPK